MADKTEPQPWHAADEKRPRRRGGAPLGTHSLTGRPSDVGVPDTPADSAAERGEWRDGPPGAAQPDPLAEPRAPAGDLLGDKK